MCDVIMTEEGDVGSIAEMNARGWQVEDGDIAPNYLKAWTLAELQDSCLCPIDDVGSILERNDVTYELDPFGWAIAPLKGEYGPPEGDEDDH